MTTQILMPALTKNCTSARLAKWLVEEGQEIRPGDIIAEIETETATMEVEADDTGIVGKILVPAGTDNVAVHTPIAIINLAPAPEQDTPAAEHAGGTTTAAPDETATPLATPAAPVTWEHELRPGTPTTSLNMRKALREALVEEMRRDETVFLIGEDLTQAEGGHRVTQDLAEEFGTRRVIDTPVAEAAFTGLAIGAAFAGLKPVVDFQSWTFAFQAVDQIVNSAAMSRYRTGGQLSVPIVMRGPNGPGGQSGAQYAQCVASMFARFPGLKVVAPATPADAKGLLKSAILDPDPVLILEHEMLYGRSGPVPRVEDWRVPLGKARVVREGTGVTLVTFSRCVTLAQKAADKLEKDGVSAAVIDLRSLRPIDYDTIFASVRQTNRIVCIEEGWPVCSISSEICARVAMACFDDLDAPPAMVTAADTPIPYAANLERLALPGIDDIVEAAKRVCYL